MVTLLSKLMLQFIDQMTDFFFTKIQNSTAQEKAAERAKRKQEKARAKVSLSLSLSLSLCSPSLTRARSLSHTLSRSLLLFSLAWREACGVLLFFLGAVLF